MGDDIEVFATHFCDVCSKEYCEPHKWTHMSLRGHAVKPMPTNNTEVQSHPTLIMCPDHAGLVCTRFCLDHSKLLCPECCAVGHPLHTHSVRSIEELGPDAIERLNVALPTNAAQANAASSAQSRLADSVRELEECGSLPS
jgi:hypothetical protein